MADNTLLYRHWTAWRDGTGHAHVLVVDGGRRRQDARPHARHVRLPAVPARRPAAVRLLARLERSSRRRRTTTSTGVVDERRSLADLADEPNAAAAQHHGGEHGLRRLAEVLARRPLHRLPACRSTPAYESDLFRLARLRPRRAGQSRVLTESFNNWIDDFDWSARLEVDLLHRRRSRAQPDLPRSTSPAARSRSVFDDQTIDAFEVAQRRQDDLLHPPLRRRAGGDLSRGRSARRRDAPEADAPQRRVRERGRHPPRRGDLGRRRATARRCRSSSSSRTTSIRRRNTR